MTNPLVDQELGRIRHTLLKMNKVMERLQKRHRAIVGRTYLPVPGLDTAGADDPIVDWLLKQIEDQVINKNPEEPIDSYSDFPI